MTRQLFITLSAIQFVMRNKCTIIAGMYQSALAPVAAHRVTCVPAKQNVNEFDRDK